MPEPFIAEIRIFAGNFAPKGWALCNGQLLSISQNTALFSLLGTSFGGDGRVTFGLPNLQSSVPIGAGNGPGLSPRFVGEVGGSSTVTLTQQEIPNHVHAFACSTGGRANVDTPQNNFPSTLSTQTPYAASSDGSYMNPSMIRPTPAGPHNNQQPYLVLNYIIALEGVFPPRG
jgi:microcystin-dependent protein